MTREEINTVFLSDLGKQCDNLYSTSDDQIFIRYYEAVDHSVDHGLSVGEIIEWFNPYEEEAAI